jgi:enoyl-CoA hydratase/carnithine racemase
MRETRGKETAMGYQNLFIEHAEQYVLITLNRPKANALSLDLVQELRDAVQAAEADEAVGAILIYGGEGRFFAAGADIPTIQSQLDAPMAEGHLLAEGIKTTDAIANCAKPVIAVVNGMALGGGCELCLACHLRIASSNAAFGQPEINLGIIPGWGGTHRLPRLIGDARAHDWMMTARMVTAEEALRAGLVCKVLAPELLLDGAKELAKALAAKPRAAMRALLGALRERALHPERGAALEKAGFEAAAASPDAAEGVAAFLEKRAPNFTGK